MSTSTAQKDDLIIIADESENNEPIFSLDLGDISSNEGTISDNMKTQDNAHQIDFSKSLSGLVELGKNELQDTQAKDSIGIGDISSEVSGVEDIASFNATTSNDDTDFSFDMGLDDTSPMTTENISQEIDTKTVGTKSSVEEISLGISKVSSGSAEEEKNDTSLNTILSQTIEKLQARQKSISEETQKKSQKVQSLKDQIYALEREVANIEDGIAGLGLESEKIESNIIKLEEMKLDPVKEHNVKRSVKK